MYRVSADSSKFFYILDFIAFTSMSLTDWFHKILIFFNSHQSLISHLSQTRCSGSGGSWSWGSGSETLQISFPQNFELFDNTESGVLSSPPDSHVKICGVLQGRWMRNPRNMSELPWIMDQWCQQSNRAILRLPGSGLWLWCN